MKRGNILKVATATVLLAVVGTAVYAQDKYSLKSPSGIAFADFRGYEDWAVVSSARTDEVLKVIVANPTMIKAYKAGVPGNGQPSRKAPRSRSCSGVSKRARRPPSPSMCLMRPRRPSSWRRTVSAFPRPAAGGTRFSIMTLQAAR